MYNQLPIMALIIPLLLTFPLLYLYVIRRIEKSDLRVFDSIMNASDYGKIVFDAKGNLFCKNDLIASKFFAFIDCVNHESPKRACFLNHLYDHAVDYDDNIKNTIIYRFVSGDNPPDFCEVIRLSETYLCLVTARNLVNGMTLFTLIDISAEQEREMQLQHLDKMSYQLMQAVQASSSGIVISDPKKNGNPILFANDAFCAIVDSNPDDLAKVGWDVLTPFFSDINEHKKFMSTVQVCSEVELELKDKRDTKDGITHYYTLVFSPVYHNGVLDLFIGLLSDITLLKRREAEFFKAQKLESLGELSAGIAHDFNNILSIISGYSSMVRKKLSTKQTTEQEYLNKIEIATKRGADLSRRMLAFSSHRVVEKVTIELCDLIVDHIEFLEPLVGASIKIKATFPKERFEEGVCIRGSVSSVAQILMNFVINARDAMPDGGNLEIVLSCLDKKDVPLLVRKRMSDVENFVRLSVIDTGIGMNKKTVERIFDPFFTTKEPGKGTGLGLSVAYGLVKELEGQVDVESKIGQGTKMSIYLPRCDGDGPKVFSGDVQQPETVRFDGYTALIAEDEPDLLNVVGCMLEDMGMKILSASDGEEALVLQEEHEGKIDILLTDVLMPGISGVKLAELFTSLRPETKVMFMSGFPANGNMAPVELPKDSVFVAKPVGYESLVQMLCITLFGKCECNFLDGHKVGCVADMPHWENFDNFTGDCR
jgi:signal transduction histidine kinase